MELTRLKYKNCRWGARNKTEIAFDFWMNVFNKQPDCLLLKYKFVRSAWAILIHEEIK